MKHLCSFLPSRKASKAAAGPNQADHDAHIYAGNMFMKLGHLDRAEAEYARAYAAFPSEESQKLFAAAKQAQTQARTPVKSGASARVAA